MVGEAYIKNRGFTNIADALNEIPGFEEGSTPEGTEGNFGVGANHLDLYNLGTQRTLTLINGRRMVASNAPVPPGGPTPSPGLQVDLNIIPVQLVERVENIYVGGAPTYGSDAIAGVVNLILKRDFEGVEVQSTYAITDRGDGQRYNGSVLFGHNFADDRGNITIAASVDNQDGVLQTERDYFSRGFSLQPNPTASLIESFQPGRSASNDGRVLTNIPFDTGNNDGIPNAVTIRNTRVLNYTAGGLLLQPTGDVNFPDGRLRGFGSNQDVYLQFAPGGNLVLFDPGVNFGDLRASGGDGFNPVESGQLTSDLQRKTLYALGRFDFTDHLGLFFEANYYSGEGLELADEPLLNSSSSAQPNGTITIRSDHPLLNDQARSTLAENGISSFRLSRASGDLVTNNGRTESELARAVIGLTGDFNIGARSFNWEISANMGQNDATSFGTALNQQNFVNAINVTRDASGNIVCSPVNVPWVIYPTPAGSTNPEFKPVADPNCVPLNLFGEGTPSAEATAYVTDPTTAQAKIRQQIYNINITGSPFDIWSGPVSFNIGYEHRKESSSFVPDDFQQLGLGRTAPLAAVEGEFSTDEIFAETLLPLVDAADDLPFLKRLDLTGKVRRVDNTVNGLFTAYTYGFQWRPFDDFEIRANKTHSLRAPAITELFLPTTEITTTVPDSCDSRNITSGTRPAVRQANCQAFFDQFGITQPFQSDAVDTATIGTLSGDPDLDNEIADAYAIGFVWQPSFIDGLEVAVDYTEIEIDQLIVNLGSGDVVSGCFDNLDFNTADVTQANPFCSRITRDQNGQITFIETGFFNGEFFNFTGISGDIQYGLELGDYGTLNVGLTAFHLKRLENSNNGIVTNIQAGEIGNAKNQYLLNITHQRDRLGLNLQVKYISSAEFDVDSTIENRDVLAIDGYWLHNAGVSYRIGDNGILRLAVTNLFDEEPPFPVVTTVAVFGGSYDLLGRRYSLTAEWKF